MSTRYSDKKDTSTDPKNISLFWLITLIISLVRIPVLDSLQPRSE